MSLLPKKIHNAILDIQSEDLTRLKEGLNIFSKEGKPELLKYLFDELLINKSNSIKQIGIIEFLSTIKQQDAIPVIINALEDKKYLPIRLSLLTVCWQTGINSADYFENYLALCKTANNQELIEITTIIEEMTSEFPEQTIQDAILDLEECMLETSDNLRKKLLESLLNTIALLPLQV